MSGEARVTIRDKTWTVSLATTPAEWTQGLSNVPSIPPGTGMLFDLGVDQVITVNTTAMLFDLDIVWIHSTAGVVDVARSMAPGYDEVIPNALARFFLEVNAGEAADVQVGDQVEIEVLWASGEEGTDLSGIVGMTTQVAVFGMALGLMGKVVKALGGASEKPRLYSPRGELLQPRTRRPTKEHPVYEKRVESENGRDTRVELTEARDIVVLPKERQVLDIYGNSAASWDYSTVQGAWIVTDLSVPGGRYVGVAPTEHAARRWATEIARQVSQRRKLQPQTIPDDLPDDITGIGGYIPERPQRRFIGGCRVLFGRYCETHSQPVGPRQRCPQSDLTDEEWAYVWDIVHPPYSDGQLLPAIVAYPDASRMRPASLQEAHQIVDRYAASLRAGVERYRARMYEAVANYERSVERAIDSYRRYVLSEYERGQQAGMSPALVGPRERHEPPEELEFFADSREHILASTDPYRQQMDRAFREAIERARMRTG